MIENIKRQRESREFQPCEQTQTIPLDLYWLVL